MASHTVILGAGYGGLLAALRLARRTHGTRRITLVNASDTFVERIRLHQVASDQPLVRHSLAAFLEGTNIELVIARATGIDPAAQRLHLADREPLPYDELVYALGSRTETTSVPGISEHAFTLDGSLERLGLALRSAAMRGGRVTVCGSGLTGVELATEIAESFPALQVTMISRTEPGGTLSPKAKTYLRNALDRFGIRLLLQGIAAIHASSLTTSEGTELHHDVCIWTGGFVTPTLAREAGLATNARNQVITDEHLRSITYPSIYAIGDAASPSSACGQLYTGCATAMPMGAYVADHLAGWNDAPFRFRPPGFCISLGRRDGLIQPYGVDERPTSTFFTGRLGAFIKESVVRYTSRMLWMTRRWPGVYIWPKRVPPRLPELPARLAS